MAATPDVEKVLAHVALVGLEPTEDERKWEHMGGLLTDAALQPRARYKAAVLPRVRRVIAEWPDAKTTSGFRVRLANEDLPAFLAWSSSSPKIQKIHDLAAVIHSLRVETVDELGDRFRDPELEAETRSALRRVGHVGPKTLDYIAILTGSNNHVAVDQHLAGFVAAAGVSTSTYDYVAEVVRDAARELKCSPGALDGAIWNYMSAAAKVVGRNG
ncbi:hypothetical protein M2284_005292 [Rhodococcus sp. LBL1]|nr:hypothetical protein [Rhodococcus sp. LBL1]MDH6686355.1 hypothetical protein [Rhodococcus sp. LBL2]